MTSDSIAPWGMAVFVLIFVMSVILRELPDIMASTDGVAHESEVQGIILIVLLIGVPAAIIAKAVGSD